MPLLSKSTGEMPLNSEAVANVNKVAQVSFSKSIVSFGVTCLSIALCLMTFGCLLGAVVTSIYYNALSDLVGSSAAVGIIGGLFLACWCTSICMKGLDQAQAMSHSSDSDTNGIRYGGRV